MKITPLAKFKNIRIIAAFAFAFLALSSAVNAQFRPATPVQDPSDTGKTIIGGVLQFGTVEIGDNSYTAAILASSSEPAGFFIRVWGYSPNGHTIMSPKEMRLNPQSGAIELVLDFHQHRTLGDVVQPDRSRFRLAGFQDTRRWGDINRGEVVFSIDLFTSTAQILANGQLRVSQVKQGAKWVRPSSSAARNLRIGFNFPDDQLNPDQSLAQSSAAQMNAWLESQLTGLAQALR